jgi:hypothetical protein
MPMLRNKLVIGRQEMFLTILESWDVTGLPCARTVTGIDAPTGEVTRVYHAKEKSFLALADTLSFQRRVSITDPFLSPSKKRACALGLGKDRYVWRN